MLLPLRSILERHLGSILLVLLALLTVLGLGAPLLDLSQEISHNYNEGWNAFHARAAMAGTGLYPEPEPGTMVFNNYPPLSFYVVGALGRVTGDAIVAGRLVALLSLIVVVTAIGWLTTSLTGSRRSGIFGALLGLGTFTFFFPHYVAMNDPQLLGHALQYVGLVVLLRHGNRTRGLVGSMALMLLGGLVKHNLLAIPLAVAIWLFVNRRRDFVVWSVSAALGVIVVLLTLGWIYGAPFFESVLFLERELRVHQLARAMQNWLLPISPLLIATGALFVVGARDARVSLMQLVCVFALGLGLGFSLGAGVSYNTIFDLVFATVVCAAVAVEEAARRAPSHRMASWVRPLLMASVSINLCLVAPMLALHLVEDYASRDARAREAADDIAFVRAAPGPVMCENAALAYWAGKNYEVDYFNYGQRVATGSDDGTALIARIERQEFSLVQFREVDGSPNLGESIHAALREFYELERSSDAFGHFYLPRDRDAHAPGTSSSPDRQN